MLAQEGQDVALESDGEGRWGGAVHGLRGGGGGDAAQGCAIPGDDAQRGEQDAPPVVSRAVAQDHLEGVVGPGGEGDAAALREVLRCGVTVLATIHGRNFADIRQRRGMENLLEPGAFERVVCLTAPGAALRVTGWNGEEIHL